jgi:hypothetical protein
MLSLHFFDRTCVVSALWVLLAGGTAFAQSASKPTPPTALPQTPALPSAPPKSAERVEAIKERARAWHTQCMQDWDAATHMTKKEWERTCRRVTLERSKFLLNQANDK